MSVWKPVERGEAKDKLFCPQCSRELFFAAPLVVPELIKCDHCKAEFCLIVRYDRRENRVLPPLKKTE